MQKLKQRIMSDAKQFVDDLISAPCPVVIFSKSYCPYCTLAKNAIRSTGISENNVCIREIDGMPNMNDIQDYLGQLTGKRSVPRVFIGKTFFGGGDDTAAALKSGKLLQRLKELDRGTTLVDNIGMNTSSLEACAQTAIERANRLEARLAVLESEKRETEAAQLQKWKRQNEARVTREQQLVEEVEKLRYQLESERSMRTELEATVQQLRSLCNTAKERIASGVAMREKLEADAEAAQQQIETLTNSVHEAWLLHRHVTEELEILRQELSRALFRQKQLEKGLERGQNIRALYVVGDLFRTLCKKVESSSPTEADLLVSNTATNNVTEALSSLLTKALQDIPKTPICLRDLSSLEHVESLHNHHASHQTGFDGSNYSENKLLKGFEQKKREAGQSYVAPSATASTCADFASLASASTELDLDGDVFSTLQSSPRLDSDVLASPRVHPGPKKIGVERKGAMPQPALVTTCAKKRLCRTAVPKPESAFASCVESTVKTNLSSERKVKKPRRLSANAVRIRGQTIKFPTLKQPFRRGTSVRRFPCDAAA